MAIRSDQQLKYNDCGISTVKSIFNYYNISIDRDYIAGRIPLDSNGAWLHDIKAFLEQHNFTATYNLLDLNTVKFDIGKLKNILPCIAPVKNASGLHYVVLCGIEKKKFIVLDPAEPGAIKWSFAEFIQRVYTSVACYEWISGKEILQQLIKDELQSYDMHLNGLQYKDETIVANKLTYFSYLKENYGFSSKENEIKFLNDLLYNLQLNTVPNEFRALQSDGEKLNIRTPVILTVNKSSTSIAKHVAIETGTPAKRSSYYRLFKEMHQYRKIWYIYIFAAVFSAFITQLMVFTNQLLIDNILPSFNVGVVVLFAVGLGLFKIFDLAIRTYKSYISIQLSNIFDTFFLSGFIKKLNSFSIRYIHSFSRGDLTERMKDSLALKTFFLKFFTSVLTDSIVSVYSLVILFIIDWKISLIILAIMVVFIIWFKIITPAIRENEKRRFLQKSALFSTLLENIDGLQVVKSFSLEYLFRQRIQPAIAGMMKTQKKVRYINLANAAVIDFVVVIATILILIFLSMGSIKSQTITIGQIITFIALSGRIFNSLINIVEENLDLQENEIILTRYLDFDGTATGVPQDTFNEGHNKIKVLKLGTVAFENVGFEYIPKRPVLKNFDLTISKGNKIRLEGSNGAGKSTFCKILSMLYHPTSGNIFINGEKLVFYNTQALRKKILLVSNDDCLFNDTLEFNITFNKGIDAAAILELSKKIGFHDFISSNAEGFDYLVTEQGKNLSTGQRKKILLLRAFLSEAELIIIDEVLSGIDKESKEKIEDFINSQNSRAFIIVSHEAIDNIHFNKTIKLVNGSVVEAG